MLGMSKSTSGISGYNRFMKQTLGALLILCQTVTGAAVAQVSGQAAETAAEPAARASEQSWVHRRGRQGGNELHWMAFKGDAAAVKELLEGGADVNKTVDNGNTPLHLAAYKGHAEVVGILLAHGARMDARNHAGFTPLDWARRKGHGEVERLLLARGAAAGGQPPPEIPVVERRPAAGVSEGVRPQASPRKGAADGRDYRIQLGSFNSRQIAADAWERYRQHYAGLLGDLEMRLETVDLRGRVYHRLQAGGFSADAARVLCAELERSGQACIVVKPAQGQ